LSSASAGIDASSVSGSSAIAARSCASSVANAPAVVWKSVISDLSCSPLRSSAAAVAPACLM
jgi:hypothetical protein